ncbi:isoform 2 of bifunctional epoxide hydrolase 2 [Aspergillus udagawae]|uniref:Isoform 2 of bifunctional epoxide hydrolase 2 n=1 Tax=Aspergillus udagawae TaxID=91492 RepID=A0ABQ1ADH2_9EURO|nr:isoform 2 of bifunctional epoxide hydrolase 2 [Aspergillus udagawae]
MASIAFPEFAKLQTLSTSHTYDYVYHAAAPSRATILFLHGFPSSCYDWRHQIHQFIELGYGVLAPDLLGYGGTSKPTGVEEYKLKSMAKEIIELLDHEGLTRVHAVAHDTGCNLLSRLADYYPNWLLSCTFIGAPYSKPGEHFDLGMVNRFTKQLLGFEKCGYIGFFIEDEAGSTLDQHADSFFSLFYPDSPDLWAGHLGPVGAAKAWLQNDKQGPLASYVSDEERTMHNKILQGHHKPALNWYHALVRNVNKDDEVEANLCAKLKMPVLMIGPQPNKFEIPGFLEQMKDIAEDFTLKRVSTTSHWIQLDAREELNAILEAFFARPDFAGKM